jgi:DNA polymerase III epsilon subunit-like protein
MLSLWGEQLCAIDVETTGVDPDYHEIIQIAIVPLNSDIVPNETIPVFYTNIAPEHIERAEVSALRTNGLDLPSLASTAPHSETVIQMLEDWFSSLPVEPGKRIIPLAHNYRFEHDFLSRWLGISLYDQFFHGHTRDSMHLASSINDRYALRGKTPPFRGLALGKLCKHFGIVNHNAHDALADSLTCAKVYRELMRLDFN